MLRQATPRTAITLLCTTVLILTIIVFTSCYKLDPLSPTDIPQQPPEPGGVGNNGVSTMTQLGATDNGGWVITVDFFDNTSAPLGEAKVEAAADLVSFVASQNFNIPGTTQLSFNNNTSVSVNVVENSDTKYKVTLTSSAAPSMPVWFLIDNIDSGPLGKNLAEESQDEAKLVDPAVFAGYVATHIVLLIGNPDGIIANAQACREEAIAACGSINKINQYYLIVRFSLQSGLVIDCYHDCTHDQGRWGFY